MDLQITCNTPDEVLFSNVEANSKLDLPWVKLEEAHEGHAVICGGGPSLGDTLEDIRWRQSLGQKVFALNQSAQFLVDNGIEPDYQIILDARPENIVFCMCAKKILLGSQVHPSLFEKAGCDAILFHPVIEGIDSYIDSDKPYTLIGGGTTVGLTAMALAYTMGYRKLHLFGYDSCHAGDQSHAYKQDLNDKDHMAEVTVNGKTFQSSLTMARQAELFPTLCNSLIDLGCIITVDGSGLIPEIARAMSQPIDEAEKYKLMWSHAEYREHSPGEECAKTFIEVAAPETNSIIADIGCGTGRGTKALSGMGQFRHILVDFAPNCLDPELSLHPFLRADLRNDLCLRADYVYCTDVMEHIEPDHIDGVLRNIGLVAPRAFFQISLVEDNMGALIGRPLHLSVHPYEWWLDKFKSLGYSVISSGSTTESAIFYLSTTWERHDRI